VHKGVCDLSEFVVDNMRKIIRLNNDWHFTNKYEDNMETLDDFLQSEVVCLPHTNINLPYSYFDERSFQFVSCYKKSITVDAGFENKVGILRFEGVMTYAKVYINGTYVGDHKGGYTPFEFDITDKIKYDYANVITVVVDSTERDDIPPFGGQIDYLTYGGIYREVSLTFYDSIYIKNAHIKPLKVMEEKKAIEVDLYTFSKLNGNESCDLNILIADKNGEKVFEKKKHISCGMGENKQTLKFENIENIKLWELDSPNLYNVSIKLDAKNYDDVFESRIGFRTCEFTNHGFYLNGEKLKIVGLNRHQSFPYKGYAMPKRIQQKDADILKDELHLNLVRTAHYPQSIHFIDRCDEIGLLVFEEIPGWQHIGDEKWKQVAVQNVKEMIERDWNHPSIILWGVRINESPDDHDFYKRTNEMAKQLDRIRQTAGVRCIENSNMLEDVYTMNDFSHDGGQLVFKPQKDITHLDMDVPYMVTECNGHMYPTKSFDQEERQMEHTLRHARIHDVSGQRDDFSGVIGWCAFDYNTHKDFGSGDRICYHGVMDMFRIKKFAADVYATMISPKVEAILTPVTFWARGERSIGGVLPLVILTNCDYVDFKYGDFEAKRFYPSKEKFKGLTYPPIIIDDTLITPKEIGEWGMKWEDGNFCGYVDGIKVIEKTFVQNSVATDLKITLDDAILSASEIDATRVVIKAIDQCGNNMPFLDEVINVEVSGAGSLVGPKSFALKGGVIAFWVETINEVGEIDIAIKSDRFPHQNIKIDVQ